MVWEQLYAPDGAVTTLEDAANGNWSYTYDALNRLLTAQCSANCPGGQASLGLRWSYDRLGNRWSQAPTAGVASTASASFTGKDNRMDTDSYDAAGNLLVSGTVNHPDYRTYTWDAEGRLTGVGGDVTASYAYDAAGRRVSTTTAGGTTLRFFDEQGRALRRIDPSGQWLSSEIYALGQPLATYDQSGAEGMTWFLDLDPVGTVRTLTNGSGQFAQACTSLPFGDGQSCSPAISDPSPLHFTGKPRDPETGLDDFGARLYSSSLGRWMSPDWSAQAEPVPYAKLDNPQSLNLYAYVLNNPVSRVDKDGHCGLLGLFCKPTPPPPVVATPPQAPAIADLHTSIKGNFTSFQSYTPKGGYKQVKIRSLVRVDHRAKPGAGGPYRTDNIVGVSNRHAGQMAYGPKGAFIDTGDSRGRDIHGGGSSLGPQHAFDPHQRLTPTFGCTRACNADVQRLGQAITNFQMQNPGVPIPYSRTQQ